MLQAGTHKVKSISDVFMGESKEKQTPYFCIVFKTEEGDLAPWQVYLHNNMANDKAKEIAIKNMETLVRLGFKGTKISDMAEGSVDDLFGPCEEEIKVVVEMETYKKDDGTEKEVARVKFVNVGTGHEKIDKKQAVVALKSLPYDGWLTQARKANPIKPENENKTSAGFNTDDIPF